jgi:hypothetical protein
MPNQTPLSPARILYEELRENEDAGLLDTCPARHASASDNGDPVSADNVEQIHAIDGIAAGDSIQPRSALAAIIRLQSTEIERLTLENDRFATRLNAVHQLLEDEQNRRRILDRQRHETSLRNQPPAPPINVEEIRRAAREGMSTEIKPVLMAILDLLESTLSRGAETAKATAVAEGVPLGAPVETPASLIAEVKDEFQQLPKILTRPLEELTSGPGNTSPASDRIAELPAETPPREPRARRPRQLRHEAQSGAMPSAMPSVFAWTNLFS